MTVGRLYTVGTTGELYIAGEVRSRCTRDRFGHVLNIRGHLLRAEPCERTICGQHIALVAKRTLLLIVA